VETIFSLCGIEKTAGWGAPLKVDSKLRKKKK